MSSDSAVMGPPGDHRPRYIMHSEPTKDGNAEIIEPTIGRCVFVGYCVRGDQSKADLRSGHVPRACCLYTYLQRQKTDSSLVHRQKDLGLRQGLYYQSYK